MANITKRFSKKGEVSYRIKVSAGYTADGKQKTHSFTWKPEKGMTARQAEKEAFKQAMIFEEQILNASDDCPQDANITFRQLAEEWFELVEKTGDLKQSSVIRMKSCRDRTYAALGDTPMTAITYRQIQRFILTLSEDGVNTRTGKGLSSKSQKHYLTFISDVFRYARRCGIAKENPCKDISVVKTAEKVRQPYSLEEEIALLSAMQRFDAPTQYQVLFRFMIYCGMRRGEVLGIEWKDIDFETCVCSINRTSAYENAETGTYTSTPKTRSSYRSLKLPDELIALLRQLKLEQNSARVSTGDQWHETDRLFTQWNGLPMHPGRPYNWLLKFCRRHDLPFRGLHSFRHAFATEIITSGKVDIKTVSAILGHSQTSTTLNIYAHEVQAASAMAMDFMSDLIQAKRKNA